MRKSGIFWVIMIGFVLRVFIISLGSYHGDLNNNISWGREFLERGASGYYGSEKAEDWPYSAPNQPPLYILMFAALSWIWEVIYKLAMNLNDSFSFFPSRFVWFWEESGMTVLAKLPSVLADVGIGLFIFKYLSEKRQGLTPLLGALIWLLNPISWYNSSVWGQTDSIVNLLGLLSIFYLLKKNLVKSALFLTLSLVFKVSLTIFLPAMLVLVLKHKYSKDELLKSAFVSIATVFFVSIWFHPNIDFLFWIINLYKSRIIPGEIGFVTANAFNLWWIVDSGRLLDSTIFWGLSLRLVGLILVSISIVPLLLKLWRQNDERLFWMALLLSSFASFLFMTRMHERYLYPVFPVATILLFLIPHIKSAYIYLSVSFLINMYNLFWYPKLLIIKMALIYGNLANYLAYINLFVFTLLYLYFIKVDKKYLLKLNKNKDQKDN